MINNDSGHTMIITLAEAFDIYLTDEVFRKYIDSGCFVYRGIGFFTLIQLKAGNVPNVLEFKTGNENKKSFCDSSYNREALERTQAYIKQFNLDYAKELPLMQAANSKLLQYMEKEHWNTTVFQEKTLLSPSDYSRLKNPEHRFDLRTYTAMAVGLDLSPSAYLDILNLAGLGIRKENKEESAYMFLISSMHGESIDIRNEFLRQQGFKTLGTLSKL